MSWLILVFGILANALASILIKVAVMPPRASPSLKNIEQILTNWPLWLGLTLYGTAFLLYTAALAKFPLNIAHPVLTTGSVALVALLSAFIFKETFSWSMIIGITLVMLGVLLITTKV